MDLVVLVDLVVLDIHDESETITIILPMKYRNNVLTSVRDEPVNRSLWVLAIHRKIPEISVKCQMEQSQDF